jgi:hypothetical protein
VLPLISSIFELFEELFFNIVSIDRRVQAYLPVFVPGIAILAYMHLGRDWAGSVIVVGNFAGGVLDEHFGIYVEDFKRTMAFATRNIFKILFLLLLLHLMWTFYCNARGIDDASVASYVQHVGSLWQNFTHGVRRRN